MTYKQVDDMVAEIGVPYSYYQFPQGTAQACPFVCFFFAGSEDLAADNVNYAAIRPLVIELYTDDKDFAMEAAVEAVLTAHELPFMREEAYIDTEKMNQVSYTTAIVVTPETDEEDLNG